MSRLLICGFGPFPQVPDNPAAHTVRALADERWTLPGAKIAYAVVPTTWTGAAQAVLKAAEEARANAVLIIGVAAGADRFRVETQGFNRAAPDKPDAEGLCWPGNRIDAAGPEERRTRAPVDAMLAAVQATGLPAAISEDPGDYLCNFTLYSVLRAHPMTAFLHVPAVDDRFGRDDLMTATRAAATVLAGALE